VERNRAGLKKLVRCAAGGEGKLAGAEGASALGKSRQGKYRAPQWNAKRCIMF
jgi:hypothetical protein